MTGAAQDSFARDNLPPEALRPVLRFDLPELSYPSRLNAVTHLLDRWVAAGRGNADCLIAPDESISYGALQARVNRVANILVSRLGLRPGHRVLLRAPNSPMLAACILAVLKAGGIVVPTMPLLRARELSALIVKARIGLALCDTRLLDELSAAQHATEDLRRVVAFNSAAPDGLESMLADAPDTFAAADTAAEDICLIAFTSGTTGVPKGTMHAHRDLLAICDTYSRHVLQPSSNDRFIGTPPLAFTFGLGGLLLFPLHAGAATVLLEKSGPDELLDAIGRFRATVCVTAPTAYRAMLGKLGGADTASLRRCVSAGEPLPRATFVAWEAATGIKIMDGIGSTEMLHVFIAARPEDIRPGATGRPVPGFEAAILDAQGNELPDDTPGRLAVRGPTGCRYLDDPEHQRAYVQHGWNITGDTYVRDGDGYFWYQARSDDMIVSAGYNIAGPEVESVLLSHPAVAECAVVGIPDEARGQIITAFLVLHPGYDTDAAMTRALQDFVKATIAPYKYPRAIVYRETLPRTPTGKLQRFRLREAPGATLHPAP